MLDGCQQTTYKSRYSLFEDQKPSNLQVVTRFAGKISFTNVQLATFSPSLWSKILGTKQVVKIK